MSSFFDKIKSKISSSPKPKAQEEQSFSIQPHPAKTNDPADLQAPHTGLRSDPVMAAHHARDPYVPSEQVKKGLEAAGKPLGRDELHARQAELNKQ